MEGPICPDKPKKMLVCTDGSENSRAALMEALALAQTCGGQIYLLQVVVIIPEFEAAAPDLMDLVGEEADSAEAADDRLGRRRARDQEGLPDGGS